MKSTPKITKLIPGFLVDVCVFSHHFLDGIIRLSVYYVLDRFESHFGSFLAACGFHLEHFGRSWSRCGRVIVDTLGLSGRPLTSNWVHEGVAGGQHGVGWRSNFQLLEFGLPPRRLSSIYKAYF